METPEYTQSLIVNSAESWAELPKWARFWKALHPYLIFSVRIGLDRKVEQNAKMWPMLTDISKQVTWYGQKYDNESWKDILTGSFKKAEFVPNVDGTGFVVLGMRTSKMNRTVFYDLVTFIQAFGDTQGVKWSEKSQKNYDEILGAFPQEKE